MSLTSESRLTNSKHLGAKRLMLEAQEMRNNTDDYYYSAQPVDNNLFDWHFTLRGPRDTEFENGIYHGRLKFPTDYPMKPPSIYLLTPNGRFEINKEICLSISGHHPETWQPSWSVRTALLALMGFMPTETNHAIGSLNFSVGERRDLARKSISWRCENCGLIKDLLKNPSEDIDIVNKKQSNTTRDMSRLSESEDSNDTSVDQSNNTIQQTSSTDQDESGNSPKNDTSSNKEDSNAQNSEQTINQRHTESTIGRSLMSDDHVEELGLTNNNKFLMPVILLLCVLVIRRVIRMTIDV